MDKLFEKIITSYKYIFNDFADERTKNYFLLFDPIHGLLFLFTYIRFVTVWGPKMMENRKPIEMKKLMMVYNVVQIIVNLYLFVTGFIEGYGPTGAYSWLCQEVDFTYSRDGLLAAKLTHIFYLLKIADLLDTVFMVLRKKNSHISFLHVYHHAGMVALTWGALKYQPGGHGAFVGFINTFVHAAMYTYYLLTTLWPTEERNRLWWKKYLTLLQIVQFLVIGIHQTLPLFQPSCGYTKLGSFTVVPQQVFMLLLFGDFYVRSYVINKTKNAADRNKLLRKDEKRKFDANNNVTPICK